MMLYCFIGVLVGVLIIIFLGWYEDYKNWKYHKNKERPLNPWNDW